MDSKISGNGPPKKPPSSNETGKKDTLGIWDVKQDKSENSKKNEGLFKGILKGSQNPSGLEGKQMLKRATKYEGASGVKKEGLEEEDEEFEIVTESEADGFWEDGFDIPSRKETDKFYNKDGYEEPEELEQAEAYMNRNDDSDTEDADKADGYESVDEEDDDYYAARNNRN